METIPSKPPSPVEKSQVSFLEKESNNNSNNKSDGTLAEKRTRESIDDDGDGENSDENQMNEENTVTKHTKKLKQDIEEATSPSASLLESGRTEAEAEAEAEADEQQEKDESENNEINNNKPTAISALHSSGVYAMRELNSEEAKIARAKRKLEFTKEDGGSSLDEHLNQNGQNTTTTGNSDNENMDRTDTTTLARVTASEDDKKRKESAGVEEGSSSAFTVPKEVDPKNIGFGFHFATDHVQLQCNSDYVVLLRTVVALEAQRLQALKDLDVLFELKNQACENPLGFLKLLKSYHKSKAEEMDKEKNEDKDKDSSNQ